ncbi:VOC family protein [Amycolatopsis keratiniphila]|uniref:Glyoxalase n=1 Tax=Amycolatopsis keratiniphila subsp. keratiniphila TaxID=227715 RepID=A0A1W2LU12_9PSEU|nr:VOC family protein [Amycolatopsis keratiniphila]OLZ61524.1 glyoxalase [Amycolatopsis keratiniphila subsp. nogabecina]ONF68864.1 glyoxalase [Amycolatopsis keratiniphila subsp. keratiniphila]SDU19072.1 Catechol 2,3-dioxygenase [Amycolatopsis keratiniphila]
MNIDRIQFLTVPVSDLTEARDFYLGKLGFDLLVDVSGPHGPFVMVGPKGADTGIVLVDRAVGGLDHDTRVHFQLTTTDVDADIAELRAQGVEVEDAEEMPWGRATSLKDPDGNAMGLLEASGYGNWPR